MFRSLHLRGVCALALLALALAIPSAQGQTLRQQRIQQRRAARAARAAQIAKKKQDTAAAEAMGKPAENPKPAEAGNSSAGAAGSAVARPNVAAGEHGAAAGEHGAVGDELGQASGSDLARRNLNGLPSNWVERLHGMAPEQQERFLRNNARFQSLPPERQAQIRRNLQRFNQLTPEQQQKMIQGWNVIKQMTPEQRQYLNNTVAPRWKAMAPDRQRVVWQHFKSLDGLTPEQREARLNDPHFTEGMSPDEQQMVRDLDLLRPSAAP
jgi:hypothetical protein